MASQTDASNKLVLNIVFEDFFKNDELSLQLNKVLVLNKEVLSSHVVGYAGMDLMLYKLNYDKFFLRYGGERFIIIGNRKIILALTLNGKKSSITIDPQKGKFVGLSKKLTDEFYVRQSTVPFFYD